MRAFGHSRRPRLVHLEERREAGSRRPRDRDARGGRALLWRVLRSEEGFAEGAFDHTVVGSGQSLLAESVRTGAKDAAADPAATYHYTVFAEDERGEWHLLAKIRLATDDRHLGAQAEGDFEAGGSRPGSVNPHAVDIAKWGTPR